MLKSAFRAKNIQCGWLYFYIHFVTEVICFYYLSKTVGNSLLLWLFPLVYDTLAFVPQSIIGYISDKFPKIKFSVIGVILMSFSGILFRFCPDISPYFSVVFLCLGNACVHINGAEVTLRSSDGKLSHSAIFVSGGSFGVITGKILASQHIPDWAVILLLITSIPFILLAETYREEADKTSDCPCRKFNYASDKIPAGAVVFLAVLVVIVRGYMGYGIPTAWKKTMVQSVILYVTMGIGKALGGIIADTFGVKKTAIFSALAAVPFLLFGNEKMIISIIGVMFFSMTMSITLALLVSVLKNAPGLAFGWTTIGLFFGTVPIFFFRLTTVAANSIMIVVLTAVSIIAMLTAIRKDDKADE